MARSPEAQVQATVSGGAGPRRLWRRGRETTRSRRVALCATLLPRALPSHCVRTYSNVA